MSEGIRQLRGIEQALWITDQFGPFNVVGVLRLRHAPSPDMLRGALDQLQAKQPLLKTRIATFKGHQNFEACNLPIPLEVLHRAAPDHWLEIAQFELNHRVDITSGPLLRCHYLIDQNGENADLVLTFHHTIVDAASGMHLFHKLLEFCAGVQATDEPSPKTIPPAAIDHFPARYRGPRFAAATAPFMMRQMGDEMRYRWQASGERSTTIPESAQACILPIQLSTPLTEKIVRASRKERITINSILTAALMLAAKRKLLGEDDASIRHVTFADLRPYLDPPVTEDSLGCYIAMSRFTTRIKGSMDFVTLARIVHEEILASNRRGEKFITHVFSVPLLKMLTSLKAFRMGHTALSYMGAAQIQPAYGSIEVMGLHAFVSNITLGPEYATLARLFRDQLWIDITYLDADMSAQQAAGIASEMQAILEAAF